MKKQPLVTAQAPAAIGPYSQGMQSGSLVITSGQLPLTAAGEFSAVSISEQTQQVLENVKAVLAAAGCEMTDVIKTTVFLTNMEEFAEMNEVYAQYFSEPYPARSTIQVARLPRDARVEIEVIAQKSQ